MSPNIIEIKEKIFKIKIENKINDIKINELIEIFCTIKAFQKIETKNGNEYEKAWLKIKYKKEMVVNEYINIFKLVRLPFLYDFIEYFTTIEKKFDEQTTDTKINIDDYLLQNENISQEIIIIMVFNIKATLGEIIKKKKGLLKIIKKEKIYKTIRTFDK